MHGFLYGLPIALQAVLIVGLIFFLVFELDHPFQGDVTTVERPRALLASR